VNRKKSEGLDEQSGSRVKSLLKKEIMELQAVKEGQPMKSAEFLSSACAERRVPITVVLLMLLPQHMGGLKPRNPRMNFSRTQIRVRWCAIEGPRLLVLLAFL